MFGLGIPEVLIILVVFAIFMFGASRVGDFARVLGRFTGEFKKGKAEIEQELQEMKEKGEVQASAVAKKE